jgi:hypothetical protein
MSQYRRKLERTKYSDASDFLFLVIAFPILFVIIAFIV